MQRRRCEFDARNVALAAFGRQFARGARISTLDDFPDRSSALPPQAIDFSPRRIENDSELSGLGFATSRRAAISAGTPVAEPMAPRFAETSGMDANQPLHRIE